MQTDTVRRGFIKQADTYLSQRVWEDFEASGEGGAGSDLKSNYFRYAPVQEPDGTPIPDWIRIRIENTRRLEHGESLMEEPEHA